MFALSSHATLSSPTSPSGVEWFEMKRATITFPDDLAEAIDQYLKNQETPPAMTTVVQTALREFLQERGLLRSHRPFHITPAPRGSGKSDVSVDHDRYFAEGEK
jgi:hypothetical protein